MTAAPLLYTDVYRLNIKDEMISIFKKKKIDPQMISLDSLILQNTMSFWFKILHSST